MAHPPHTPHDERVCPAHSGLGPWPGRDTQAGSTCRPSGSLCLPRSTAGAGGPHHGLRWGRGSPPQPSAEDGARRYLWSSECAAGSQLGSACWQGCIRTPYQMTRSPDLRATQRAGQPGSWPGATGSSRPPGTQTGAAPGGVHSVGSSVVGPFQAQRAWPRALGLWSAQRSPPHPGERPSTQCSPPRGARLLGQELCASHASPAGGYKELGQWTGQRPHQSLGQGGV